MVGQNAAELYGLRRLVLEESFTLGPEPVDIEIPFTVPRSRQDYEVRLFLPEISGFAEIRDAQAPAEFLSAMVGFSFAIKSGESVLAQYRINDASFRKNNAFNFGEMLSFWVQSSVSLKKDEPYTMVVHFPDLDAKADIRLRAVVLTLGVPRRVFL
jgi:hypothetical protein